MHPRQHLRQSNHEHRALHCTCRAVGRRSAVRRDSPQGNVLCAESYVELKGEMCIRDRRFNFTGERCVLVSGTEGVGRGTTVRGFFFPMAQQPLVGRASSLSMLHDHTQTHTTVGRSPLEEWPARHKYLYLTTHTRQTSMLPAGFEPAIPVSERPQTHTLDRASTWIGII
jgi:hypothetical protein